MSILQQEDKRFKLPDSQIVKLAAFKEDLKDDLDAANVIAALEMYDAGKASDVIKNITGIDENSLKDYLDVSFDKNNGVGAIRVGYGTGIHKNLIRLDEKAILARITKKLTTGQAVSIQNIKNEYEKSGLPFNKERAYRLLRFNNIGNFPIRAVYEYNEKTIDRLNALSGENAEKIRAALKMLVEGKGSVSIKRKTGYSPQYLQSYNNIYLVESLVSREIADKYKIKETNVSLDNDKNISVSTVIAEPHRHNEASLEAKVQTAQSKIPASKYVQPSEVNGRISVAAIFPSEQKNVTFKVPPTEVNNKFKNMLSMNLLRGKGQFATHNEATTNKDEIKKQNIISQFQTAKIENSKNLKSIYDFMKKYADDKYNANLIAKCIASFFTREDLGAIKKNLTSDEHIKGFKETVKALLKSRYRIVRFTAFKYIPAENEEIRRMLINSALKEQDIIAATLYERFKSILTPDNSGAAYDGKNPGEGMASVINREYTDQRTLSQREFDKIKKLKPKVDVVEDIRRQKKANPDDVKYKILEKYTEGLLPADITKEIIKEHQGRDGLSNMRHKINLDYVCDVIRRFNHGGSVGAHIAMSEDARQKKKTSTKRQLSAKNVSPR